MTQVTDGSTTTKARLLQVPQGSIGPNGEVNFASAVEGSLASLYNNDLPTAIADIGSTPTTLLINTDTTLTTGVTVPATLTFQFTNQAMIVNSGGSITFEGIGLDDPMSEFPVFSGFAVGDVSWTGSKWPLNVSSELFYYATDSVSERLKLLTDAFAGKIVTFHVHPRTITAQVMFNDGHSLYFLNGVHNNTWVSSVTPPAPIDPPFVLGSNCTFSSEPGTTILGSNVDYQNALVATASGADNVIIENNHFKGQDILFDGVASNCIINGGTNCHIRDNWFDAMEGYNASIVSSGSTHSKNCSIEKNLFTGFLTQNAHIADCEGGVIRGNRLIYENLGLIGAPIDLESNSASEHLDDIVVEDNYIYFKNNQLTWAQIAATVTTAGQTQSTVTAAGMTNSPVTVTFDVEVGDGNVAVGNKLVAAWRANADISAFFHIRRGGHQPYLVKKTEGATDPTLNFTLENVTSEGITNITTSNPDGSTPLVYGIIANPASTRGFHRLKIRNNTVVSASPDRIRLTTGVKVGGARVFEVSGNTVVSPYIYPIIVTQSTYGKVFDNYAPGTGGAAFAFGAVGNMEFYNNSVNGNSVSNDLIESEGISAVTSSGTTLTMIMLQANDGLYGTTSHVYESYIGREIEFNNSTYTIDTVTVSDTIQSLTVTSSLPTTSTKQYTANGTTVNTSTDEIDFGSAHGMSNGCAVLYVISSGVVSGGLTDGTVYYIRSTGTDSISLYPTRADAVADTNIIDITSTGSGVHNIWPVFQTNFSSNLYWDNVATGYDLAPNGSSQVVNTIP